MRKNARIQIQLELSQEYSEPKINKSDIKVKKP